MDCCRLGGPDEQAVLHVCGTIVVGAGKCRRAAGMEHGMNFLNFMDPLGTLTPMQCFVYISGVLQPMTKL